MFLEELANFTFVSKYARYNEKEQRRETWEETVKRVRDMHLKRFKHLPQEDLDEIKKAFQMVQDKLVVPSMRSMQFGGKAVEAHEARIFNCLDKKTKFITSHGVKSFEDFKDGDEVSVLAPSGAWRKAKVRYYGKDWLRQVKFSRYKNKSVVWATEDHTWLLKDGSRTESLKIGDRLLGGPDVFSQFVYNDSPPDERLYWAYGYVYGDGTLIANRDGESAYSMVRLCKEESKYLPRFKELGFSSSTPLSCGGDNMVYTGAYLKKLPDPDSDDPRLIRAFVRGYLDADGEKNHNGAERKERNFFHTIQATGMEAINFIRKCFPIAGVYVVSEADLSDQVTNYGPRTDTTIRFRVFNHPNNQVNANQPFRVQRFGKKKFDEVWCLEVEGEAAFVLPNGIVTGNCAVSHVHSLRSFAEIFYLLLCGCGVGIGLSKHFLDRLPNLVDVSDKTGTVITYVVEDTIEGWADSIEALLNCYFKGTAYTGRKICYDYSKIRRKGTPLKTGGGKAPGYTGLKNAHIKIKALLDYVIEHEGHDRLLSVHAYDILMHCSDAVLSGGIRRSATSVLFEKTDEDMLNAKVNLVVSKREKFSEVVKGKKTKWEGFVHVSGRKYEVTLDQWEYDMLLKDNMIPWYKIHPQRGRSNNSVVLMRGEVTAEEFKKIIERTRSWGEPGFVFADHPWQMFNPCFEIGFIPVTTDGVCGVQFCNLTSINGAKIRTKEDFVKATWAATLIGTLQATYTNFKYLSNTAKFLTEEESLLGVSITGMMDNAEVLLDPSCQREACGHAVAVNETWAKKLGIKKAARITCIKPEGTSSLVLMSASGIHPHHARRYFRRIQCNKLDNVYKFFKKHNPHMCEESVHSENKTDDVICFPVEIPEKAIVKEDLSSMQHLEMIKATQKNWVIPGCTDANTKNLSHNVSCTVIVRDGDWESVGDYLFENRQYFAAVSLLAETGDKMYQQAPLEKVLTKEDEEKWDMIVSKFKMVDYKTLVESDDKTEVMGTVACGGGKCEMP